ncbi:DUF3006 domain-containing protein [Desulfofundulus salinus]|nr:DUF3006 domain-containing protein [Desulfofundulus salinum]
MKAVVDRMGGEFAVILLGREEYKIILPRTYLPEETMESDVLDIAIKINRDSPLKRHKKPGQAKEKNRPGVQWFSRASRDQ